MIRPMLSPNCESGLLHQSLLSMNTRGIGTLDIQLVVDGGIVVGTVGFPT